MVSISDIVVFCLIALFTVIGLAHGIFKKLMGLVVTGASAVVAYYVASPISAAVTKASFYSTLVEKVGAQGAGWIVLVASGLIVFIIVFILLKILVNAINKGIESGKILKFANRLIGGVFGLLTGLLFATVYLLVLYGLAQALPSVNTWYIADIGINPEHFTVSKYLIDSIFKVFEYAKATI